MHSKRTILTGALVAGLLAGCDRPKVEQSDAAPSKPERVVAAQQEVRSYLPPLAAETPAPQNIPPAPAPDPVRPTPQLPKLGDSAPQFAPQFAPPLQLDPSPPDWEQQLSETSSRLQSSDRARAIFAMMPSLPPQALATATELALEGLSDADYRATALPVITNPKTHGQVLSPMFSDLLDRSDAVTLPTLLDIATTPDHPFAPEAVEDLKLLLGADYGTDWVQWTQAIRQILTAVH